MRTVTRHITTTTKRAKEFCATLPPETIRWAEKGFSGTITVRAGDIAARPGALDATLRYVDEEVYLDNLTPQAQELAQIAHPRNHSRSNDYIIVCTQPYSITFHWPVLRDDETGNEYYERCALLVQLGRGLIDSGVSLSRTRTIMSHAENWTRPWTVEEVIRQENQ